MSVETYLMDQIKAKESDEPSTIRVGCRLDPSEYNDLKAIAKRLGVAPTTAANGLLESAIVQAVNFLNITQSPNRTEEERTAGINAMKGIVS